MKSPFEGLSGVQIHKLYELLGAHIYFYRKNQEILPTMKNNNMIGVVLEGSASIQNVEYNGNTIVLETLEKDSIFGTNISATHLENYEIVARQDAQILIIDYSSLIRPENLSHGYYTIFLRNLFDIINMKFRKANERIKVLEEKQIRDKILMYFEIEFKKGRRRYIELPFSWKDFADYIASNRTAMFRELKSLKEEGFISVKGRRVFLLYKDSAPDLDL